MRFREYESEASTSSPSIGHACVEYSLSPSEGKNGNDGTLVWSAPKPSSDDATANSETVGTSRISHIAHDTRQLCQDLFLPIGYPKSVADGYLEYQFYDSLQGLCSYLRGVVSTSAVLSATGVGNAKATAMSAAMTWAVRDGLGMIGGLMFSYIASPHFDAHVKEFRLLADVLNDIGLTLDMALPLLLTQSWFSSPLSMFPIISGYLPSSYLVLTSTSTLCKVACGMAAGATKGNITDHFAISGNRADCQSKESTQETLVSLVGMCLGVWLASAMHKLENVGEADHSADTCDSVEVGSKEECASTTITATFDAQMISWSIFIILTLVHVWANYVGMEMLRLRTLNHERAKVALQPLVEDCARCVLNNQLSNNRDGQCDGKHDDTLSTSTKTITDNAARHILPPKTVSESLWRSMYGMIFPGNIHLGVGLKYIVRHSSAPSNAKWSCGQWDGEKYAIFLDGHCNGKRNLHSIIVLLRVGADERDELKAFLHASVLRWCFQNGSDSDINESEILSRSHQIVKCLFQRSIDNDESCFDLYHVLGEKGWDTMRLYLGFGPNRCEWEDKDD